MNPHPYYQVLPSAHISFHDTTAHGGGAFDTSALTSTTAVLEQIGFPSGVGYSDFIYSGDSSQCKLIIPRFSGIYNLMCKTILDCTDPTQVVLGITPLAFHRPTTADPWAYHSTLPVIHKHFPLSPTSDTQETTNPISVSLAPSQVGLWSLLPVALGTRGTSGTNLQTVDLTMQLINSITSASSGVHTYAEGLPPAINPFVALMPGSPTDTFFTRFALPRMRHPVEKPAPAPVESRPLQPSPDPRRAPGPSVARPLERR